ncbi:MAG: glycosyltransferase family 39 protein [Pseudomonadota bacterium]
MPGRTRVPTTTLRLMLLIGIGVSLLLKIWLATRLELYSDEIFYWLASTRPALAYSDLPFMTAWLVGLGSQLADQSTLAVRSLFLALGTSIPLLVVWISRPVVGERDALYAGLLTLCLPLLLLMGLLAVPDVPLIVLGLLTIGLTERATRLDTLPCWMALGSVVALGMSTHYRFVLFPLALILFLLISSRHRHLWGTTRLWTAGAIALVGLYPTLAFNVQNDLSGLDYHLVSRHPWRFQSEGLMHLPIQLLMVTPLLYLLLLSTLIGLWREAHRGDHRSLLLALFATVPLALYLLLAPWSDTTRTTLHWPLSGYLPLLVHAPHTLRMTGRRLRQRLSVAASRRLLWIIPGSGLLGGALVLIGLGSQGFNTELQRWIDAEQLSNKMAGWRPLSREVEQLLSDRPGPHLLITDNYYTAAQIAFHLGHGNELIIHTTDLDKAVRDGRLAQLQLWGMHESSLLQQHPGTNAVFITEDATLNVIEKREVIRRACGLLDGLDYVAHWPILDGIKPFSVYRGTVTTDHEEAAPIPRSCPMPSRAWLDTPLPGSHHEGQVTVSGWAFNDGQGIESLTVLLNGQRMARIPRDISRPDVVRLTDAAGDPDAPDVGFHQDVTLEPQDSGPVTLALEVLSTSGERQIFGSRTIRVGRQPPDS